MATHAQDDRTAARELPSGWYAFAGALLIIVGSLNLLQGLIALLKDDYFAVTKGGLLFADYSAWGTFFIIVGIVQLPFIAAFPIWTLAAIIINIAAICALMRPLEDYQERRGYIE